MIKKKGGTKASHSQSPPSVLLLEWLAPLEIPAALLDGLAVFTPDTARAIFAGNDLDLAHGPGAFVGIHSHGFHLLSNWV